MDYLANIKQYIDLEISILQKMDHRQINELLCAVDSVRRRGGTVYIMGNGGSAATASHFANDFNKGISEYLEQKFCFVSLNDNIATIMAIANDIGYDAVFEFQLRGRLTKDDLVIGISGSGNSKNVLTAVEYAKTVGASTAGLTGFDGGKLRTLVDISVHAPVMSMQVSEDVHLLLNHLMSAIFYKELCQIDHVSEGAQ